MHRKLLSEKSEKYAIKLVPQGGGGGVDISDKIEPF